MVNSKTFRSYLIFGNKLGDYLYKFFIWKFFFLKLKFLLNEYVHCSKLFFHFGKITRSVEKIKQKNRNGIGFPFFIINRSLYDAFYFNPRETS